MMISNTRRVLLIEDDPWVCRRLDTCLKKAGIIPEIQQIKSKLEFERFVAGPPAQDLDIILVDDEIFERPGSGKKIPRQGGPCVVALRQIYGRCPIFIWSGRDEFEGRMFSPPVVQRILSRELKEEEKACLVSAGPLSEDESRRAQVILNDEIYLKGLADLLRMKALMPLYIISQTKTKRKKRCALVKTNLDLLFCRIVSLRGLTPENAEVLEQLEQLLHRLHDQLDETSEMCDELEKGFQDLILELTDFYRCIISIPEAET